MSQTSCNACLGSIEKSWARLTPQTGRKQVGKKTQIQISLSNKRTIAQFPLLQEEQNKIINFPCKQPTYLGTAGNREINILPSLQEGDVTSYQLITEADIGMKDEDAEKYMFINFSKYQIVL